jgi:hypothetical protein
MSVAEFPKRSLFVASQAYEIDAVDIDRVATVAHHVIATTQPGKLGYVKLNRILWYSDLEHFRWHGQSITELRQYLRMPLGPMSPDVTKAVGRLVKERKVTERTIEVAEFKRREMISLRPPDISTLADEQIAILDQIVRFVVPLTANQLSQMAYDDPLWQETANGDAMSVATGSIMTRPLTSL